MSDAAISIEGDASLQGDQAPNGDPGTAALGGFTVRDGKGQSLAGFVDVSVSGTTLGLLREVDGVLWAYSSDGTLTGNNAGRIYFPDVDCQGVPMIAAADKPSPQVAKVVRGVAYVIDSDPALTRGTRSSMAPGTGCNNNAGVSRRYITAKTVPIPPALPGPLTVQANP